MNFSVLDLFVRVCAHVRFLCVRAGYGECVRVCVCVCVCVWFVLHWTQLTNQITNIYYFPYYCDMVRCTCIVHEQWDMTNQNDNKSIILNHCTWLFYRLQIHVHVHARTVQIYIVTFYVCYLIMYKCNWNVLHNTKKMLKRFLVVIIFPLKLTIIVLGQ